MEVDLAKSMDPEKLYVCEREVRVTGKLEDGREAFSLVPSGTPVVPVVSGEGVQSLLMDGRVIPFSWTTPGWRAMFCEADCV